MQSVSMTELPLTTIEYVESGMPNCSEVFVIDFPDAFIEPSYKDWVES